MYLFAIGPTIIVKLSAPYWFHLVGYSTRFWVAAALMSCSFIIVGCSKSMTKQVWGLPGSRQAVLCAAVHSQHACTGGPPLQLHCHTPNMLCCQERSKCSSTHASAGTSVCSHCIMPPAYQPHCTATHHAVLYAHCNDWSHPLLPLLIMHLLFDSSLLLCSCWGWGWWPSRAA